MNDHGSDLRVNHAMYPTQCVRCIDHVSLAAKRRHMLKTQPNKRFGMLFIVP